MFNFMNTLLGSVFAFEGETAAYDFGLDAASVVSGMLNVIKANIGPILALMGLMLGAGWVIKYFRKARKGSI